MSVRAQLSELPSNKATKALAVMYDTYAGDPGDAAAVQHAVSVLLERQQPETCTAKVAAAVHAERLLREALGSSQARTAQHLSTYAAVLGLTNLAHAQPGCVWEACGDTPPRMLPADTYAHWAAQLFRTGTPSPAVVDAIIGDYASQLRAATKTAVQDHELLYATQLLTRAQPYAAGTRTTLTAAVTQVGSVYHCYGVPSVLDGNRSAARLLWISDRQNHGAPLDTDTVHTSAPAA